MVRHTTFHHNYLAIIKCSNRVSENYLPDPEYTCAYQN